MDQRLQSIKGIISANTIPWYQRAMLVYEYHATMLEERGQARPKIGIGWSMRDTSDELGIPVTTVFRCIKAAKYIPYYPKEMLDKTSLKTFCRSLPNG